MKYPCFCKVWNISYEPEIYFTIVTGMPIRFVDHNGSFWDCAVPLTDAEFNDPVKALVGIKAYNHLTKPPEEIEPNVALNLLHGCQNCGD